MVPWLCDVFGFAQKAMYPDGQGGVAHAELTLGSGMIMLGSSRDDDFGQLQSTPAELGGTTQSPYLVAEDADAIYQRAKEGGAKSWEIRTRTTAAVAFPAAIPKVIFGTLEPTIHGKPRLRRCVGRRLHLPRRSLSDDEQADVRELLPLPLVSA